MLGGEYYEQHEHHSHHGCAYPCAVVCAHARADSLRVAPTDATSERIQAPVAITDSTARAPAYGLPYKHARTVRIFKTITDAHVPVPAATSKSGLQPLRSRS